MIGKWIITYKGTAVDGGSVGFYECSNCHKKCCATEMPQYFFDKDGKWHDPNFCPNCGSDNRKREDNRWNNAEVIINNLQELLSNYEEYKDMPEINAEEFMQTLEGRVAELQNEVKDDVEKRFVIEAFSVVANYLHEKKKRDFV